MNLPVDVLLLDIVIVLALARLLGALARRIGLPPVIGEILAGILLGPTLLGHLNGDNLFPETIQPSLQALADVGLVLFMFVIGLELDQALVRGKERIAAGVALGTTLVPFGLGALLALIVADDHAGGRKLAFVLFLGTAMSVTAFPVMARILTDRGMHRTLLGGLALAAAGVADVLAWTMLAVVIALAGAGDPGQWRVTLAVPFGVLMFVLVRPQLRRLVPAYARTGRLTPGLLALVLLGLFASAWATEWIQVHFIFGAFLFGAVMPRAGAEKLINAILQHIEQLAVLLLLPMFFVTAGLKVDLSQLDVSSVALLAVILVVAIGGKLAGTYAGARLMGMHSRESGAIATLMNTRGLTEIVILTVGLDKGVVDDEVFSLMVVMALLTTATTGPLLRWIYPDRLVARDIVEAESAALGATDIYQVVAVVEDPPNGGPLTELADGLVGGVRPAEVVLANLHSYPDERLEVGTGLSSELADMAETLDAMERLAARVRRDDVPVRVVSRFAADVAAELPVVVASADLTVEVVLAPVSTPGYPAIRSGTTGRLITVMSDLPSGPVPVAVRYDGGIAGSVAAEMALRLAVAGGQPLIVVGSHPADELAERLSGLGADVRSEPVVPAGTLVVAADEATDLAEADGVLVVRAEQDAAEVDWETSVALMLADRPTRRVAISITKNT